MLIGSIWLGSRSLGRGGRLERGGEVDSWGSRKVKRQRVKGGWSARASGENLRSLGRASEREATGREWGTGNHALLLISVR